MLCVYLLAYGRVKTCKTNVLQIHNSILVRYLYCLLQIPLFKTSQTFPYSLLFPLLIVFIQKLSPFFVKFKLIQIEIESNNVYTHAPNKPIKNFKFKNFKFEVLKIKRWKCNKILLIKNDRVETSRQSVRLCQFITRSNQNVRTR